MRIPVKPLPLTLFPQAAAGETLEVLLAQAGVQVNGSKPWDIQVRNRKVLDRIWAEGPLGLGETYMEGAWDCEKLDQFIYKILKGGLEDKVRKSARYWLSILRAKLFNLQSISRAVAVADAHYNLDQEIFKKMLDERMLYTCAYWEDARSLEEAQEKKLDLICRKLGLKKGMTVLDLGCGWGSFAKYAAERYGARVTGFNISKEQVALGRELCKGLPVKLKQQDYRKVQGKFDRVVSIGLMEQVGPKNYATYFEVVAKCLEKDGIAFVHTIGNNTSHLSGDPWFNKYIFPNFVIPSLAQLFLAMEGKFIAEDVHNIGPHYDPTLMEWNRRFQKAWPQFKKKFPKRFKRMWEYYLLSCAGAFRSRELQLWQIVMTPRGTPQPQCRFS